MIKGYKRSDAKSALISKKACSIDTVASWVDLLSTYSETTAPLNERIENIEEEAEDAGEEPQQKQRHPEPDIKETIVGLDPETILQNAERFKTKLKSQFPGKNAAEEVFKKLYEAAFMRHVALEQFEKVKMEIMGQISGGAEGTNFSAAVPGKGNTARKHAVPSRNQQSQHQIKSRPESCAKMRNSITRIAKACQKDDKRAVSTMKEKLFV